MPKNPLESYRIFPYSARIRDYSRAYAGFSRPVNGVPAIFLVDRHRARATLHGRDSDFPDAPNRPPRHTPSPLRQNFFKFPAAVLRTLRLSDGDQPSSTPGRPRAWRDQRQKLKRSRWVAISPSGVKVKVPSMMLCTVRPVALKR